MPPLVLNALTAIAARSWMAYALREKKQDHNRLRSQWLSPSQLLNGATFELMEVARATSSIFSTLWPGCSPSSNQSRGSRSKASSQWPDMPESVADFCPAIAPIGGGKGHGHPSGFMPLHGPSTSSLVQSVIPWVGVTAVNSRERELPPQHREGQGQSKR